MKNNQYNQSQDKQSLINYNDDDDNDEQIEQAIDNIVGTAIARLSDESDEQHNNNNNSATNKFLNNNKKNVQKNDVYICQDNDDDDDEKQQLIQSSSSNKRNYEKNICVKNNLDNNNNDELSERHLQQQQQQRQREKEEKKQKQRLLQQQQQRQQQQQQHRQQQQQQKQRQLESSHHTDQRRRLQYHQHQQPPSSNTDDARRRRSIDHRANKFTAENIYTDIVNENIMGITPQKQLQQTSANNNDGYDNSDDAYQASDSAADIDECSKFNWYIYLVTILSAIGGFLFGYDTGIVSGAMVFIRDYFQLSTTMQEIVISVTILTAWIFSFIAGYLTNRFGRKITIILASFVFTIGGFMMALSHTEYVLLIGRAVVGLAIGLASMAIPVYIAEVAPVNIRGKLVSTNVCFITFGQFIASIVAGLFSNDQKNGWRWMLGLASVPSILQMIFFVFLPESPRWLVQKERYQDALDALRKFRNADTSDDKVLTEFNQIKESCLNSERERKNDKSFKQILSNPIIMQSLFVGSMLSIFQQVAGINTVMYYSATIIQMSGINDKSTAVWLSALTASINFIFSFVGLVLVERIGRRLLILSSLCGVVFSLFMLAAGFQLAKFHSPGITFHSNDYCSSLRNCDSCVSSQICGYCFYQTDGESSIFDSLSMSNVNGTCLPMNETSKLPFDNSTYCVNNNSTTIPMQWATDWCPSEYSWMTLVGLMLYLFFFAPGMGPMPWTINSEIYPLWARSFCYSVSTSFNWFFNLLVSLTFLTLTNLLTIYGAFYLYAGLALFGLIMFFFILPETKGKKLEEIECLFQGSLFKIGLNNRNQSNQNNDQSFNASRSTVLTSASNETTNGAHHNGNIGDGTAGKNYVKTN